MGMVSWAINYLPHLKDFLIKIQNQKLCCGYLAISAIHQLATSSENLVTSTLFLVALATSESQFQALLHYQPKQPKYRMPVFV